MKNNFFVKIFLGGGIFLALGALIVWYLGIFFRATPPAPVLTRESFDWQEQEHVWSLYIDAVGLDKGYDELVRAYQDQTYFVNQHNIAHVIGILLYKRLGIAGVAKCRSNFGLGCYHSFFTEAVRASGPDIVPTLNEACNKLGADGFAVGCEHGIGHAVVVYAGFERSDLLRALALCDRGQPSLPVSGCVAGAYMEYNFRQIMSIESEGRAGGIRPFDPQYPNDPCDTLPDRFQESCYYSQPEWWGEVLDHDYRRVGELCGRVPDRWQARCFAGTGRAVGQYLQPKADRVGELCWGMPMDAGRISCALSAGRLYADDPATASVLQILCTDLAARGAVEVVQKLCGVSL